VALLEASPYLGVQGGGMKRVTIYTTGYCAWCAEAKDLLRRKRVYFDEVDVTYDLGMRERLVRMSGGQKTVPQVWVGGVHVGGYRDLVRLDERGMLDVLLGLAEAPGMGMETA
jgi:glutaredoxin 3